MSVLSEKLKGMECAHILDLDQERMLELLGMKTIAHGRSKCLMLGLEALKKTLKARQSKE
jgi:sulfur transfer protein SufE